MDEDARVDLILQLLSEAGCDDIAPTDETFDLDLFITDGIGDPWEIVTDYRMAKWIGFKGGYDGGNE